MAGRRPGHPDAPSERAEGSAGSADRSPDQVRGRGWRNRKIGLGTEDRGWRRGTVRGDGTSAWCVGPPPPPP